MKQAGPPYCGITGLKGTLRRDAARRLHAPLLDIDVPGPDVPRRSRRPPPRRGALRARAPAGRRRRTSWASSAPRSGPTSTRRSSERPAARRSARRAGRSRSSSSRAPSTPAPRRCYHSRSRRCRPSRPGGAFRGRRPAHARARSSTRAAAGSSPGSGERIGPPLLRRELKRGVRARRVVAWPTVRAPAPPIADPTVELPSGRDALWTRRTWASPALATSPVSPAHRAGGGTHSSGLPMASSFRPRGAATRCSSGRPRGSYLEHVTGRQFVDAVPPIARGRGDLERRPEGLCAGPRRPPALAGPRGPCYLWR